MKKTLCVITSIVLILSVLCGCNGPQKQRVETFALDTMIVFDLQVDGWQGYGAAEEIGLIHTYEDMFSATKEGSDIYNINNADTEGVKVCDETANLIREAIKVSEITDGAFDISLYEIQKLWGFDTKEYNVPDESEIKKTLENTGYKNISITDDNVVSIKNSATLDLGGIAKGYIAEAVVSSLDDHTPFLHSALVNFGGMIDTTNKNQFRNDGSWIIGVEYPSSDGDYFATFKGVSATTSGDYQRYFEKDGKKYHHIIDPKTGKPAESDISSVTITNKCCAYVDAMSTAFFVMGKDKTIEFIDKHKCNGEDYSVIILSKDKKTVYITADLMKKDFTIVDEYKDRITVQVIN